MQTSEQIFTEQIDRIKAFASNKNRVEFKDTISVGATDSWPRSWVREVRLIKGVLMVTINTEKDRFVSVATAVPAHVISLIHKRLFG